MYYSVYTSEGTHFQTYTDKELAEKVAIVRTRMTEDSHFVASDQEEIVKHVYGVYHVNYIDQGAEHLCKLFYARKDAAHYVEMRNKYANKEDGEMFYIMKLEIQ